MLINIRISELYTDSNNGLFLAILTLLCFNYLTSEKLPNTDYINNTINSILSFFGEIINYIFFKYESLELLSTVSIDRVETANCYSPSWDTALVPSSHVISIGNILYTKFSALFIMLAFILLLAMIGAIIVTTNKSSKKTYDITWPHNS